MPAEIILDPVDEKREQRDGPNRNQIEGYTVGQYSYPPGLASQSNPDRQHYVVFIISVREQGELADIYKRNNRLYEKSEKQKRESAALQTEDFTRAGRILTDTKVAASLGGLFGLLKNLNKGFSDKLIGIGQGAVVGGGSAAAIRALDSNFLTQGNSTYQLKDVITLHIENSPSVRYGVNYTEKDLGTLTGLLGAGSAAMATGKLKEGAGKEILSRFIAELIKLPSILPGGATLADIRELSTRQKLNPFREVLFESVDYRSFNFKYRFFPTSPEESRTIRSIIKLFKLHMHPEISDNKLFYMYPSEFQIKYYYKNSENTFMNSIGRCALVGMDVEYGGDQFATFEDGSPVEIGLSLTFRELEQITTKGVMEYGY